MFCSSSFEMGGVRVPIGRGMSGVIGLDAGDVDRLLASGSSIEVGMADDGDRIRPTACGTSLPNAMSARAASLHPVGFGLRFSACCMSRPVVGMDTLKFS